MLHARPAPAPHPARGPLPARRRLVRLSRCTTSPTGCPTRSRASRHSLCTLEFKDNRDVYDWLVTRSGIRAAAGADRVRPAGAGLHRPEQAEAAQAGQRWARDRWDDPRMPTLAGHPPAGGDRPRRSGPSPTRSAWRKSDARTELATFEYAIRDDLNMRVPRVMAVTRPLKVVLTNYPADQVETFDAPLYPHDVPRTGSRTVPFSRELWIERDDFMEDAAEEVLPADAGREVRLRYGYLMTCTGVVKDASGEVVEVHATYDPATRGGDAPDGRRVQGTIHWVSARHALDCELRLYDRLFAVPDPDALPEGRDFIWRSIPSPWSRSAARSSRAWRPTRLERATSSSGWATSSVIPWILVKARWCSTGLWDCGTPGLRSRTSSIGRALGGCQVGPRSRVTRSGGFALISTEARTRRAPAAVAPANVRQNMNTSQLGRECCLGSPDGYPPTLHRQHRAPCRRATPRIASGRRTLLRPIPSSRPGSQAPLT